MEVSKQAERPRKPMDAKSSDGVCVSRAANPASPRMQQTKLPLSFDVHVSKPVVESCDVAWPGPQTVRRVQSKISFVR